MPKLMLPSVIPGRDRLVLGFSDDALQRYRVRDGKLEFPRDRFRLACANGRRDSATSHVADPGRKLASSANRLAGKTAQRGLGGLMLLHGNRTKLR